MHSSLALRAGLQVSFCHGERRATAILDRDDIDTTPDLRQIVVLEKFHRLPGGRRIRIRDCQSP